MFVTRLISGIVLVVIALVTIICGGPVLFVTLMLVSLIGMNELYRVMKAEDQKWSPLAVVGYLGAVGYYCLLYFQASAYTMIELIGVLIAMMFIYVFTYPRYRSEQVMAAFFGVVYVAVMLSYIFQTRNLQDGVFTVWLIFLCSWGCDTCAYCVGVLIGRHKMSPKLSPKKSIEGAVGGVAGAALLGGIYAAIVGGHLETAGSQIMTYAIICAAGALISMVGDLAASAIKRNHEIKDYGSLIPGHGGILDRFDSVIFTAPVIYFLAELMMH
ncbi:MAG: phosphatidate cytidylyltransferase [Lachnospiraceae bacterium]|nr:phosphatidate cytidylyltransferase [Lachnospiraceae bacterium]